VHGEAAGGGDEGGGGDGDGEGGEGCGGDGEGGGSEGDGGGGLGLGGGELGDGGTGQAVWQTYFSSSAHVRSYHLPPKNAKQSSRPPTLLGSPEFQLVYDSGVLDGLHTHVPSDAASVPPIHTGLPAAAVLTSASCAADCTVASCRPAAWQAASAPAHERALFMSV
jgi:hypothetical protein